MPSFSFVPQKAYIFTFLLSSRLFIEPRELLARVCHLCIEQQQLDKPVLDKVRWRAGQGVSVYQHSPAMPSRHQPRGEAMTVPVFLTRWLQGVSTLSEAQSQKENRPFNLRVVFQCPTGALELTLSPDLSIRSPVSRTHLWPGAGVACCLCWASFRQHIRAPSPALARACGLPLLHTRR